MSLLFRSLRVLLAALRRARAGILDEFTLHLRVWATTWTTTSI